MYSFFKIEQQSHSTRLLVHADPALVAKLHGCGLVIETCLPDARVLFLSLCPHSPNRLSINRLGHEKDASKLLAISIALAAAAAVGQELFLCRDAKGVFSIGCKPRSQAQQQPLAFEHIGGARSVVGAHVCPASSGGYAHIVHMQPELTSPSLLMRVCRCSQLS